MICHLVCVAANGAPWTFSMLAYSQIWTVNVWQKYQHQNYQHHERHHLHHWHRPINHWMWIPRRKKKRQSHIRELLGQQFGGWHSSNHHRCNNYHRNCHHQHRRHYIQLICLFHRMHWIAPPQQLIFKLKSKVMTSVIFKKWCFLFMFRLSIFLFKKQ